MGNKARIWISLLVIVALSWIELQFYSEASDVGETERRIAHILFLLAVMGTGYIAWLSHPIKWIKSIWTIGYSIAFLLIVGVGVLQWKLQMFGTAFLDEIRDIRIFFSSPLPFIMLLAIPKREKKQPLSSAVSEKN